MEHRTETYLVAVLPDLNCSGRFFGEEPTSKLQITEEWLAEDVDGMGSRLTIDKGVRPSAAVIADAWEALQTEWAANSYKHPRREKYLQSWPPDKQLEALVDNANGDSAKLDQLNNDFNAIRSEYPKPE
jgi:hypothetical protein